MEELNRTPNVQFGYLAKSSVFKGGSFSSAISDARNLGFISNGDGLHLTGIGKQYLDSKSKDILKSQALTVPLFHKAHKALGNENRYTVIRDWIGNNKGNLFTNQFIGSVASRYVECINGYTPKRIIITKKEDNFNLKDELFKFGLSKSDVAKMVSSIKDEDKREKVLSALL